MGSTHPYPRELGPGQAPPGWEQDDPTVLVSYVGLSGYDCQRIHLGPFERGPVRIVLDLHDRALAPEECREAGTGRQFILIVNAVIVNDPEIATYLQNWSGLPATYAKIETVAEDIGPLKIRTWTWGPGATKSALSFPDDGTSAPNSDSDLLFWQRGDGIGSLELHYTRSGFQYTERPGHGTMESPMLLAEEATNTFVGPIRYFSTMSGEGLFRFYEDLLCKVEAPP